ncbi:MAG TPA: 3-isopropylmalate dehydrogenase [Microbacteriaceae bacterium]
MDKLNLAVIPGDGIGQEVTPIALEALKKALVPKGVDLTHTEYDLGAERYLKTAEALTDKDMHALSGHDAILLGAVGDPRVPSGVLERGLLLKLRFAFDHHINLRPARSFSGVQGALAGNPEFDFLVVREGTEGPYVGNGGSLRVGTNQEVANEVSVNTAFGVERVVRFAFSQANSRNKKLTLVHKTNVLTFAGNLWQRIVDEVASEFPQVKTDYMHIDAATIHMVTNPSRFDVIVTDNLFGDIITDLAAAIGGGIGLAASANLNPTGTFPSMFEPVHGSAPDIAGNNLADPTAAILSAGLLAEQLGYNIAAEQINLAVSDYLAEGTREKTTDKIAESILSRI